MQFSFTNQRAREVLQSLGYAYRKNMKDFVRNDTNGRFHAKVSGNRRNRVNIHYDLIVDGQHIASIPMPNHFSREQSRICKFIAAQNKIHVKN